MRYQPVLAISAILLLAACGGDPADEAASGDSVSPAEIAERVDAADIKPQPGRYRSTVEIQELDIPGAPPQMAEMMRSQMGSQTNEYCLTQEESERGFEEMARQSQEGSDCQVEKFDAAGGKIDARMACTMPGQGKMTMTMVGTGSSTGSEMDMTMKGNFAGPQESTIRMKVNHERIGDCQ